MTAHPERDAKRRAILLVDHGSVRDEANALVHEIGRLVAAATTEYHVEVAHMELAPPTIDDGFAACVDAGANDITVHPHMLGPGRHSREDIPRLVAVAAEHYPDVTYRVAEPLGADPGLAAIILRRVAEARAAVDRTTQAQEEKTT